MVCLRGESPTHHTNQMKFFNAVAGVTVICLSVPASIPVQAGENYFSKVYNVEFNVDEVLEDVEEDEPVSTRSASSNSNHGCPSGTRMYRTSGFLGMGARDIGCLTAYEAESLRRQRTSSYRAPAYQHRQCYTNKVGFQYFTNCY